MVSFLKKGKLVLGVSNCLFRGGVHVVKLQVVFPGGEAVVLSFRQLCVSLFQWSLPPLQCQPTLQVMQRIFSSLFVGECKGLLITYWLRDVGVVLNFI